MKNLIPYVATIVFLHCGALPSSCAVDDVAGTLFTLTNTATAPNGAWSWFQDERAIVDDSDPENPLLLVSSVSAGPDGSTESGDIDLLWRNLTTGAQGEFELHNRLERDDHDSAALYLRPDGRYLAMYSRHNSDSLTRWRVSTNPHDATAWGPVQTLNNGAGATYNNIYHLSEDDNGAGRTYNFTRAVGFDPMVQVSGDHGSTWSNVGQLLSQGDGGDRPYLRYASDGKKIHFITTEEHPRDFFNSVFHGYIQDGMLYNTHGDVIDGNLFDPNAASPTALTRVFENGSVWNGTTMNRAWTISLEMDNTGNPVAVFSARANDSSADHRFFYARFDGDAWQVNEMARAGGFLYAAEADYTGLASIDPDNPNVVFMSTKIDPRSQAGTSKYELYKGTTTDFGKSWTWSAITENSSMDNLRPVVPQWNGQQTVVAWLRGTYTTYTNWDTEIVGLKLSDSDPKALLWRGDAVNASTWDINGSGNWDSGGGVVDVFNQGDEVAFDDTAVFHNIALQTQVTPSGVAFNNQSMPFTLTGHGIAGTGGLRVIGGGTVTLANEANIYTGETLIARGTLVVTGGTSLQATSRIRVLESGTFDVSTLSPGEFTLQAQDLVLAGRLNGNTVAVNDSNIYVDSIAIFQGNVDVHNANFSGDGVINGNLTAHAGSFIRVGGEGISTQPAYGLATYYDATTGPTGNTTLANGTVYSPTASGGPGPADGQWTVRTGLASHGTAIEAGGTGAENGPALRTTITGLTPGAEYLVSTLFWDANGDVEQWNIRAGFEPDSHTFYANGTTSDAASLGATPAGLATNITYSVPPTLFVEANRTLLAGDLGTSVADDNGQLTIFIDDMPSPIGANNRTWYDGIALRQILPPESLLITLDVGGDYVQHTGATLALDIYSPDILDQLSVVGSFTAAGHLVVSLGEGAPDPQLDDEFHILQANGFIGQFDTYDLPILSEGLAWNLTKLNATGQLQVVRDVDLDNDGDVDGRDFLAIQRNDPSLIAAWQELYGGRLFAPQVATSTIVPEPTICSLVCIASATSALARVRFVPALTLYASQHLNRR